MGEMVVSYKYIYNDSLLAGLFLDYQELLEE